jgi:hypothetical protein
MRSLKLLTMAIALGTATLATATTARADETDKLTYVSFSKPVQLPGVMLPAGRYRFQLADVVETRRVIKVQSEDGKKQIALLLTVPNQLRDIPKDPLVLFSETAVGQPDAVKAFNYPGERTGFEFVYSKAEALIIAHRTHESVLAKSGDKIERIDENGNKAEDKDRRGAAAN